MAEITTADIKRVREITGAGMSDVKNALVAADGDHDEAIKALREKGLSKAGKLTARVATQGLVHSYLHRTAKDLPPAVGVLLQLNCETDFVAKNEEFGELAREIALHIASMAPRYVTREQVPAEIITGEREIYAAAAREEGKPEQAIEKVVEGRVEGFYKDNCLLEQKWVKDGSKTIAVLIEELSGKLGEKIEVGRFARFKVGEA